MLTGAYTYDSARYIPIAAKELAINRHCVATSNVGGSGLGTRTSVNLFESTDPSSRTPYIVAQATTAKLRFILYAKDAEWDRIDAGLSEVEA